MAAEPYLKFHTSPAIAGGTVELHPLANGTRLDVTGKDAQGRPVRLQTRHFEDVAAARLMGAWVAAVLCIEFRDCTGEGHA